LWPLQALRPERTAPTPSKCSNTSRTSSSDRVKFGSAGLLILWPLVKLASAIVAMHARRTGVIEMERR
jgi:hypothetical protein